MMYTEDDFNDMAEAVEHANHAAEELAECRARVKDALEQRDELLAVLQRIAAHDKGWSAPNEPDESGYDCAYCEDMVEIAHAAIAKAERKVAPVDAVAALESVKRVTTRPRRMEGDRDA